MATKQHAKTTRTVAPGLCGAPLNLAGAPYIDQHGDQHTTASCELEPHTSQIDHAAYLNGKSHTIVIAQPPTHTWTDRQPDANAPGVCDVCAQYVADQAKHAEWHRDLAAGRR